MVHDGHAHHRRLGAALVGLLVGTFLAGVPIAAAGSIAYVDGNEVWVSTLDGSRKERLSNGENEWRAVAAADNGMVLGQRIEDQTISQFARIQLWGSNGQVISQGPLASKAGWTLYAAPLSLDLTADGVFVTYGYAGQTGFVPNATFERGHYVILSETKVNFDPIGQTDYTRPTTFGNRLVTVNGSQVNVQAPESSNPFATTWNPILDTSGTGLTVRRADVAATGKIIGLELEDGSQATQKIAVVSISGVDPPVSVSGPVDCFIPAAGKATAVTFSQDGTRMAWRDDQGVKVAGVPTTAADPCVFSSPPIVISATGSSPSIGGADLAQLRPVPVPPTAGATVPPLAPQGKAPKPTLGPGLEVSGSSGLIVSTTASATALSRPSGLLVQVTVPARGPITVTGSIAAKRLGLKGNRQVVVATGSARATKAGTVSVRLKLTAQGRKFRKRLKGSTILLRLKQGGRTTTKRITLR